MNLSKWKEFEKDDLCDQYGGIHIGTNQPHNSTKAYYTCLNTPIYDNPKLQLKNKYPYSSMRYFDNKDSEL